MPRTILLAEDHEDNRIALLTVLQREGYATVGARNGREAVEMARELLPDLVVMDLAMPEMDGREAVRLLRLDPATRDIPVVALTAMSLSVTREQLQAEGFAGLLSKPCMPPHLVAEVRKRIGPPEDAE
jgi:two-component system cell cycle response regulator DivK